MADFIYESAVNFLTLERAKMLVPPEFLWAYDWYIKNEGNLREHLPMGSHSPQGAPLCMASQAGIHSPSYRNLQSRGGDCKKYALTIASSYEGYYRDQKPLLLEDGSWLYEYCAHEARYGDKGRIDYNAYLMNCLTDGVPVGVIIRINPRQYKVMGLAFIESFNALTNTFHLHGPVNAQTEQAGCFISFDESELTAEEEQLFEEWDPLLDLEDHRERVEVSRVRRRGQSAFRQKLLRAYEGSCAVTEVDVDAVLQAAHVYPYRGEGSQVVSNGMLLRADIHQLYDAHLLTIDPGDYRIRLSDSIKDGVYGEYNGATINVPSDPVLRPNKGLLELHFNEFSIAEKAIA